MTWLSLLKFLPTAAAIVLLNQTEPSQIGVSAAIMLIAVFDIADGRVAKWLRRETAKRRLLDNITDIVITHSVCLAVLLYEGWSLAWYLPLLVRDMLLCFLGSISLVHSRVVVYPNAVHKAIKMTLALAAVAVLYGYYGGYALAASYALLYITLADYYGLFRSMIPKQKSNQLHLNEFRPANLSGLKYFISAQQLLSAPKKPKPH